MEATGMLSVAKRKDPKVKFKYPASLIFDPEQLKAVIAKSNLELFFSYWRGGCGKTTTLLAILFKHTGKHVAAKNRKKVVFFIPKNKILLRRDIQNFVQQNFSPEWVQLSPLENLDTTVINTENIYMIDEFYGSGPELTKKLAFSRGNLL